MLTSGTSGLPASVLSRVCLPTERWLESVWCLTTLYSRVILADDIGDITIFSYMLCDRLENNIVREA